MLLHRKGVAADHAGKYMSLKTYETQGIIQRLGRFGLPASLRLSSHACRLPCKSSYWHRRA